MKKFYIKKIWQTDDLIHTFVPTGEEITTKVLEICHSFHLPQTPWHLKPFAKVILTSLLLEHTVFLTGQENNIIIRITYWSSAHIY